MSERSFLDSNVLVYTDDRSEFSIWDSLILQAARQANCKIVYTEDLQEGRKLDGLEIVNPFAGLNGRRRKASKGR